MMMLTIYALFGDSFRALLTTKDADDGFYTMTILCLGFFVIEIILASIVKDDYWLSFFFWLDVISTLSLLTDIAWVWDEIVDNQDSTSTAANTSDRFAKASRASRAGTRAARIVRIIRVIRLVRIVKLYKLSQAAKEKLIKKDEILLKRTRVAYRGGEFPFGDAAVVESEGYYDEESELNSMSESFSIGDEHVRRKSRKATILSSFNASKEMDHNSLYQIPKESKVGKKLSDLTTKRVILLVLIMMIFLPLFALTFYFEDNNSSEIGLNFMIECINSPQALNRAGNLYVNEHKSLQNPLIFVVLTDGITPSYT